MTELQQRTVSAIVNIFETGRVRGDYGAVTVLRGDKGHLSYGRSQTTLGSGLLFELLERYCAATGANQQHVAALNPNLGRFKDRDFTLDVDAGVKMTLQQAGRTDPVMRQVQDAFFNEKFFAPAVRAAEAFGITNPLGVAVVYDSHIQGGWGTLSKRKGRADARGEQMWVRSYVEMRRQWLLSLAPPLPTTVYRMEAFDTLITANSWALPLPMTVRGIGITERALSDERDEPARLRLETPYLRGPEVERLQQKLKADNRLATVDGVYGPFTDTVLRQWQKDHNVLNEVGVGPQTRQLLGL